MRTKVTIRLLSAIIFTVSALAAPVMAGFAHYFEREFVLKTRDEIQSAKLSGIPERLEATARASYEALRALRDGVQHLISDLAWLFGGVAILALATFWVARRIPN